MKIYMVGMYSDRYDLDADCIKDVRSIVKCSTSYYGCKKFILDHLEEYKNDDRKTDVRINEEIEGTQWVVNFKYKTDDNNQMLKGKTFEWIYRIEEEELEIEENVPNDYVPELEKKNKSLEEFNFALKNEIGRLRSVMEDAACHITFWDGGIYENFDNLLKSISYSKHLLRDELRKDSCINKL